MVTTASHPTTRTCDYLVSAEIDYDPAYPECGSCGYLLPLLTNSD